MPVCIEANEIEKSWAHTSNTVLKPLRPLDASTLWLRCVVQLRISVCAPLCLSWLSDSLSVLVFAYSIHRISTERIVCAKHIPFSSGGHSFGRFSNRNYARQSNKKGLWLLFVRFVTFNRYLATELLVFYISSTFAC